MDKSCRDNENKKIVTKEIGRSALIYSRDIPRETIQSKDRKEKQLKVLRLPKR